VDMQLRRARAAMRHYSWTCGRRDCGNAPPGRPAHPLREGR
jgi:hypothetical protein